MVSRVIHVDLGFFMLLHNIRDWLMLPWATNENIAFNVIFLLLAKLLKKGACM